MQIENLEQRVHTVPDSWWWRAGRAVVPEKCLLCGGVAHRGIPLCNGCAVELPVIGSACVRCAVPLPAGVACGACLGTSLAWDRAVAAWSYSGTVPWLVRQFKYHGSLVHGRVLAQGLLECLTCRAKPDLILPVPLHPQRLRQRGFNQSLELARPIGQGLGVPVNASLARRVVNTAEQSRLDATDRRRNVRSAFRVTADLRGLSIAIVDDVLTTGNTAGELSRTLRQAGAQTVQVWVCARAEPPPEKPFRNAMSQ